MMFSNLQLAAIYNLASLMAASDGLLKQPEEKLLGELMTKMASYGAVDNAESIVAAAKNMQASDAVITIIQMDAEQKKVTAEFIKSVVLVDGTIDRNEKCLYDTVCKICGIPC